MKARRSKLDKFAQVIEDAFGVEKASILDVQGRLKALGCTVSTGRLSQWWEARQGERLRDKLLERVASGAALSRDVEKQFTKDSPPELATLINLQKTLVLGLTVNGVADPEALKLSTLLMKPVVEFAKLQQAQRDYELAREKFQRDTCKLFLEWAADVRAKDIANSPQTNSEKIERLGALMFGDDWADDSAAK